MESVGLELRHIAGLEAVGGGGRGGRRCEGKLDVNRTQTQSELFPTTFGPQPQQREAKTNRCENKSEAKAHVKTLRQGLSSGLEYGTGQGSHTHVMESENAAGAFQVLRLVDCWQHGRHGWREQHHKGPNKEWQKIVSRFLKEKLGADSTVNT